MNSSFSPHAAAALRQHRIESFALANGEVLPEAVTAFLTFGELAPNGRNAILVTHGYTSGPDMLRPDSTAAEGSWSELVGPGKPIDTERFFVVCPNMLGSSYGSTNGASIDPRTGRPYGLRFPGVTLADIVSAQRALLDHLGVRHLVAVVGPSFGGFQAFQWAVSYPDFVGGIVAATSAPFCPPADVKGIVSRLAQDPNWHDGDYYDVPGGVDATLTRMRAETLRHFGIDTVLAARFPDATARDAEIQRIAATWAERFDANSMVILMRAAECFDLRPQLSRIAARVLFVLSSTDRLFPPTLAPGVMDALWSAGVQAAYHEIDSPHGHFASGVDAGRWAHCLAAFIEALTR